MSDETQAPASAPSVRKRLRAIVSVGIPVVLLAGGVLWWRTHGRVSTDDAQVDCSLAPITTKVGGTVVEIRVQDNQAVKAGDVLVVLDPRDLQAQVDQAHADLDQAEASADAAGSDHVKAETSAEQARTSDVSAAEATLAAKQAAAEKAQADLARLQPLADRKEISAQQMDAVQAQARIAASELKAAQDRLAAARQETLIRQASAKGQGAKTAQARAAVESAKARLAALELQLGYTVIKAPIDGTVTRKSVQLGQNLQAGQGLFTLVPLHEVFVTANFKETQLDHVHPGDRAEVQVAMDGRTIHGRVDSIAASTGSRMSLFPPENATGNFVKVVQRIPVKITLDAKELADSGMRPGMNVDATIFTD
ncbi:MAG TPA: HlyD family secretion protein [Holophagaceae bacterium]|nr:HlyD family secretion protein [Holophagaceae bacterium]